jgi:hypothetical protein
LDEQVTEISRLFAKLRTEVVTVLSGVMSKIVCKLRNLRHFNAGQFTLSASAARPIAAINYRSFGGVAHGADHHDDHHDVSSVFVFVDEFYSLLKILHVRPSCCTDLHGPQKS